MMSSRTVNGVKIGDRGNKALSHEVVMLLKTQDAGYLRTALQKTRLERQKFESSILLEETSEESRVNLLGREYQLPSKKVFVDSQEEQNTYAKSIKKPSTEMEDKESLERDGIEHPFDEEQLEDEVIEAEDKQGSISNPANDREAQKRMLQALKRREEALIVATRELELQRAKMSNTVGGVNKNGVKFKIRERKR
jgi:U3 small nucleolar RNA-associated protein 11